MTLSISSLNERNTELLGDFSTDDELLQKVICCLESIMWYMQCKYTNTCISLLHGRKSSLWGDNHCIWSRVQHHYTSVYVIQGWNTFQTLLIKQNKQLTLNIFTSCLFSMLKILHPLKVMILGDTWILWYCRKRMNTYISTMVSIWNGEKKWT